MRHYLHFSMIGLQLAFAASALAQTTPPGVTATPELADGTAYWLWALIAVALIGMGIWIFTRRGRR